MLLTAAFSGFQDLECLRSNCPVSLVQLGFQTLLVNLASLSDFGEPEVSKDIFII